MISPRLQRMVTSTAIKGASNGVIRHNVFYISQGQNAAVAIWNSLRSSDNILVDNNLAAGSGFSDVRRRLSSFGAESRGWFFCDEHPAYEQYIFQRALSVRRILGSMVSARFTDGWLESYRQYDFRNGRECGQYKSPRRRPAVQLTCFVALAHPEYLRASFRLAPPAGQQRAQFSATCRNEQWSIDGWGRKLVPR